MKTFKLSIALLLAATSTYAADYHVSLTGSDQNTGAAGQPFRSFKHAVAKLKQGDSLIIAGGRYTEPLILNKIYGKVDRPITIRAAAGEKVILDGTDALDGAIWESVGNGIYKAKLDEAVWQLFADDQMMTPARWPNTHMTNDNFFRVKETNRMVMRGNSPLGTITDARPRNNMTSSMQEHHFSESAPIRDDRNLTSLAGFDKSMKGAVAVMNIGSWMNFVSRVTEHDVGSDSFKYDAEFSESGKAVQRITDDLHEGERFGHFLNERYWHPHYYFLEGLQLLDVAKEYWYEKDEQALYYKPEGGVHPETQNLRGKRRSYMLEMRACTYVNVVDVDFFGATFNLFGCLNSSVENSELYSPTWNQFQIGNLGLFPETRVQNKNSAQAAGEVPNNRIVNCRFSYLDGVGIRMLGKGNTLENCLFHDLQYSNLNFSVGLFLNRSIVRNCSLYRSGGPEGFRDGMILESNRVWEIGGLTHDGSCFQLGGVQTGISPTVIRNNWVHDTSKVAYRYDAGRGVTFANGLGMFCNNVSWNSRGMQIKGDDHMLFNNTTLGKKGLNLSTAKHWMSTNDRTITANNLLAHVDGAPLRKGNPPGVLLNNVVRPDPGSLLRDPANLDFRPKANSELSGTGSPIDFDQAPEGYFEDFFAMYTQQDPMYVGAYTPSSENYSIPGFRTIEASTPVPPHCSTTVKIDADLMWLTGYQSTASKIYFGTSREAVSQADESSPEYKGTQTNNIYTPSENGMAVGKHGYWRIDSVQADGSIVRGPVWSFQVEGTPIVEVPREPMQLEVPRGGKVVLDGVLTAEEWPQLNDPNALQPMHLFGDASRAKGGEFAVHHDERFLYLMARIPDLGAITTSLIGPNQEGFHTAWEVSMKWDNDNGPLANRTYRIAVFPDGSIDPAISATSYEGAQKHFNGKWKPMEYAVQRDGNGMTVEMQFKLKNVKSYFKSESNRVFFNTGIVIDALPYVWAPPVGSSSKTTQDGVLILKH